MGFTFDYATNEYEKSYSKTSTNSSNPYSSKYHYIDNLSIVKTTLAISPKFSFNGKYTLSPSLQVGYNNFTQKIDYSDTTIGLIQNDTINLKKAYDYNGLTFTSGLLLNTKKYYIGITLILLNKSLQHTKNYYPTSSNIHIGYNFYTNYNC